MYQPYQSRLNSYATAPTSRHHAILWKWQSSCASRPKNACDSKLFWWQVLRRFLLHQTSQVNPQEPLAPLAYFRGQTGPSPPFLNQSWFHQACTLPSVSLWAEESLIRSSTFTAYPSQACAVSHDQRLSKRLKASCASWLRASMVEGIRRSVVPWTYQTGRYLRLWSHQCRGSVSALAAWGVQAS